MHNDMDSRLRSLENQLRLLLRVAGSVLLLGCLGLAAFAWNGVDSRAATTTEIGRYQVFAAGTNSQTQWAVIDTSTGEVRPIHWASYKSYLFKPFGTIAQKKK